MQQNVGECNNIGVCLGTEYYWTVLGKEGLHSRTFGLNESGVVNESGRFDHLNENYRTEICRFLQINKKLISSHKPSGGEFYQCLLTVRRAQEISGQRR